MGVSILTFADLGEVRNLKTADILPVIDKFSERGELTQVFCRREKNFYFKNTQGAFGTLKFFIAKAIGKSLSPLMSGRAFEWKLLDNYVNRKLKKDDVIIFHPALFPKTLDRCKETGIVSVGMATVGHPSYVAGLKKEEFEILDIPVTERKRQTKKKHISNFSYIIAFSDFVKETYARSGFPKEKIFVAYSDIDDSKFIPKKTQKGNKFRVLYVANTTPFKGLQYLLKAWQSLNIDNAELVIVGGYKRIPLRLKEEFERIIGNDPTIKDVGHTDNVIKYYQDASVFILPSLTEGNPRVVMEAMACGVPIITTKNAQSIVEDSKTGFVVPVRDSEAIKEKIQYLYNNSGARDRMGRQAREAIENKKDFGESVYEIYQEILKQEGL